MSNFHLKQIPNTDHEWQLFEDNELYTEGDRFKVADTLSRLEKRKINPLDEKTIEALGKQMGLVSYFGLNAGIINIIG